jgi:cytochrome c553
MKPFIHHFSLLAGLSVLTGVKGAVAAEPTAEGLAFFEKKIRPVLVEKCYKCHSANSEKLRGELRLDTREGIRKGGESGHAVVPKDLNESLIIEAIRYEDEDTAMPPKEKLPASVIANFEKWIMMGAPDPRENNATIEKPNWEKSKNHWAFKAPKQPVVPKVIQGDWARSDIDHFILAQLEKQSLKPTDQADRRTLIRRLFFDLNGVPPQPKEVEAFVADKDPKALEKLVDRLLASESFGERWGRHWLDVARYAESSGKEANLAYPHAWRYRDYVIDSFNADKPYNQFIREQLAGDLMPARDNRHRAELMTATGFLALGPKSHNERNRMQFTVDLVDEQIETMSRSMLGLTVACARCHDHKFDPIPQREYYSLAGILYNTETYFGTIEGPGNRRSSRLLNLPAETADISGRTLTASERARLEKALDDGKKARDEIVAQARRERRDGSGDIQRTLFRARAASSRVSNLNEQLSGYTASGQSIPRAMGVKDRGVVRETRLLERGEIDQPGERVGRGFVSIVNPDFKPFFNRRGSGRQQMAEWIVSPGNPLTARVMVNRIWHHLFGQGLVRSMDNFGSTGDTPSHPELLDHLALQFVDQNWSIKKMIRQVVLSRTYQMVSDYDSVNYQTDPDNRYLWRMSKRRLDAESLRDAMLSVSGLLNWDRPRGSAVAKAGNGQVNRSRNLQSRELLNGNDHRSVFLPIVRDLVPPSLDLFDYAEPSLVTGKRDVTTVPSQALYLMNNPYVTRAADNMARRLFEEASAGPERVTLAFKLALGRAPTTTETQKVKRFFDQTQNLPVSKNSRDQSRRGSTWSSFCQALLCSAEFRYLN